MFEMAQNDSEIGNAKIRVIGIGGGGCNAVNTMIKAGLSGVEYIVANTDAQALNSSLAPTKIQLGGEITKGLGAGANPEVGRKAALEEYEKLSEVIEGADMIFVTAGMGGGTGTGAAPVVAKLAKELGCLTVGIVTKPFMFEGKKRMKHAKIGIETLEDCVDSLITIPNQKLLYLAGESLSLVDTFKKADEVLLHAVQGISDLINNTGLINADFADVATVMADKGLALMGTGVCSGEDRAIKAANEAISSPLLEDISIDGARGIIVNITGGASLTTHETNEAMTLIMEAADEDAEIIFGTVIDEDMDDDIKITVIATGLGDEKIVETRVETPAVVTMTEQAPIVRASVEPVAVASNFEVEEVVLPQYEEVATRVEGTLERPATQEEVPAGNATSLASSIKDAATRYEAQKTQITETSKDNYQDYKETSRAKSIAERLGFINFDEDEFDTPSYLRKDETNSTQPEQ